MSHRATKVKQLRNVNVASPKDDLPPIKDQSEDEKEVPEQANVKEKPKATAKTNVMRHLEVPLAYAKIEQAPKPIPRPIHMPNTSHINKRKTTPVDDEIVTVQTKVPIKKPPRKVNYIHLIAITLFTIFISSIVLLSFYIPNTSFADIILSSSTQQSPPPKMLPRKSRYNTVALGMKDYVISHLAVSEKRYAQKGNTVDQLITGFMNKSIDIVDLIKVPINIEKERKNYFGYALSHFPSRYNNRGKGLAYVKTTDSGRIIIKIPFLDIMYNIMKKINIISQPTYACCTSEDELVCSRMKLSAYPNIFNETFVGEAYTNDEKALSESVNQLKCSLQFISETESGDETKLSKLDRTILFNNHVEMIHEYITSVYIRLEIANSHDNNVKCNVFVQSLEDNDENTLASMEKGF